MVYDSDTFKALHPLTEAGEISYRKILEQRADEILFKSQHPFKWAISKIREMLALKEVEE